MASATKAKKRKAAKKTKSIAKTAAIRSISSVLTNIGAGRERLNVALEFDDGDALDWLIEQLKILVPGKRVTPASYVNTILGGNDDLVEALRHRCCGRWREINSADFENAVDGETVQGLSQFIQSGQ